MSIPMFSETSVVRGLDIKATSILTVETGAPDGSQGTLVLGTWDHHVRKTPGIHITTTASADAWKQGPGKGPGGWMLTLSPEEAMATALELIRLARGARS